MNKIRNIGYTYGEYAIQSFFDIKNFGEELKNFRIADIGAGFSGFPKFLKDNIPESNIYAIDPIFKDSHKDALIETVKKVSKLVTSSHGEIDFKNQLALSILNKFRKENDIIYKDKLETTNNIKIAFCTNLFYNVSNPIEFLNDILSKLSNGGKLYIFDYDIQNFNLDFLRILSEEGIINENKGNDYLAFEISKEDFFSNFDSIKNILEEIELENLKKIQKFSFSNIIIGTIDTDKKGSDLLFLEKELKSTHDYLKNIGVNKRETLLINSAIKEGRIGKIKFSDSLDILIGYGIISKDEASSILEKFEKKRF